MHPSVLRQPVIMIGAATLLLSNFAIAQPVVPAAEVTTSTAATTGSLHQELVQRLINEAGINATVCVYVEDAKTSEVLVDVNGTRPMIPASNNKLVTTAAALSLLGPDYKFRTQFFTNGPIENGELNGDLIVYGGGDPTISARYQADKMDVTALMRGWAAKLKELGVKSISGNIVADDSFFDTVYFHPNWYQGERAEYYSAEISGLAYNDNCIDIDWSGVGLLPETSATYKLNPITDYVTFESSVTVVAKGRPTERYYKRGATENNISVTGTINADATKLDSAAVHDGALYFATVFSDVLTSEGVAVKGKAKKARGAAYRCTGKLFEFADSNMLRVCETINLNSQNFFAESVCKTLGRELGPVGSFEAGCSVIEEFIRDAGIYNVGHHAEDGSGLAGENHVTGRQLVEILRYMDNKMKDQWRGTLPQGEIRGSLKRRFQDSENGREADQRILGKTGSIGGVRSLSGIVTDLNGREMYYSIILNQLRNNDTSKGMTLIDNVAVELARTK